MKRIIDTNVLLTANGAADHREFDCMEACIDFLEIIKQQGIVVIDDGYFIMGEYRQDVHDSGQPGLGDKFLKWLLINEWSDQCEHVSINAIEIDSKASFSEFPNADGRLAKFDLKDRKFVAVALTHPEHPPIVNATDSDWTEIEHILRDDYQVQVIQLCS
ncbi:hypothetical protein [Herpetosiphon sp. NSE202]|uniref:hypothetical protein n=1 Tax=Herpetosiphon sp. NSE202 TaxID=3351349 RepID=UPI00362798CB